MKKLMLSLFISLFLLAGTSSAATLFSDEILSGAYTFDGGTREMVMTFETVYQPYDSETKVYFPNGTGGAGTTIYWVLALDFTDWVPPGGELPGLWFESWINNSRAGDFDYFSYVKTGTNDLGENIGEYFGRIVGVTSGPPLGPEGPWYIFGNLTRTNDWTDAAGVYQSSGTIEGVVTNAPVPEPATMMLFGIGLLGLAGVSRRKIVS